MIRLGTTDIFKPSYNPSTIPYIVDVLNKRHDVEFRHAESNDGEFRIYDKKNNKFYYADAYSKELNLWIEFDEEGKFKNGILQPAVPFREHRIKEILGCRIQRIKFSKIYSKMLEEKS